MIKLPKYYRRPVFIAILIHIALFLILIISVAPTMFRAPPASAPMQTIHATAIVQASSKTAIQPVSSDRSARASERVVEEKKQAEITAKKVLVLQQEKQEKLAKLQAAEKIKKAKAEKLKKEKLAKAAAQKKQQEKLAKQKAEKLAQAKKLTAEQKALQQKLMQQALNSEQKSLAAAQSQQGVVDQYKAEILSLVQSNWRIDRVNDKLKCIYSISLAPDGSVLSVALVKSSGDDNLDQSARQAIMQSSPLPVPKDPAEFDHFRQLVLSLSPQGFVTG
jgi:colicin import membrane protein